MNSKMITIKPSLNMRFLGGKTCHYANSTGYALNVPDIPNLMLGRTFGEATQKTRDLRRKASPEYFAGLAENSGLISISQDELDPGQVHALAVFGYIEYDCGEPTRLPYEIFRLNGDGSWSFKDGCKNNVTNTLNDGIVLTTDNLKREFDRHILSLGHDDPTFGGFFKVPEEGLKIEMPL